MLRIALCDDEQKILDEVSLYIKQYAEKTGRNIESVCFSTAPSLLSTLEDGVAFDAFILDIYIGNDMGTLLAKSIRKLNIESPIIFLTTSIEHAPESFETGTLRYLLKPLSVDKFYEAMDVALAKAEKAMEKLIKLKTESGVENVNAVHIMCSEAHGHYQYVTLESGKQIRVRMTVAELHEMLMDAGGFLGVGRAYIINLRNIKNIDTATVRLYHNISIPIPRGKYSEIKKAFWDFQCDRQED